jgi:hypothetical protein
VSAHSYRDLDGVCTDCNSRDNVENGLHLLNGLEPGPAAFRRGSARRAGAVEMLDDSTELGSLDPRGAVLDLLELQERLVGMLVRPAAEFAAVVGIADATAGRDASRARYRSGPHAPRRSR